jgi:uncharacterized membrane protein
MQANYQLIKSNSELRWHSRNQLRNNWGYAILAVIVFSFVNSAASSILVGPLTVGLSICFINLIRYGRIRIENVFDGFKTFGTSFLAILLRGLITFFLFLLLIVPGVIASLAYAMTPYIINDNPGISATDALRMSREMMKGFKGKLFLMYLSFTGWVILSIFTCYIGFLWLGPYMQASIANFYENLREAYGLPFNPTPNLGYNNNYSNNSNPNYNNYNSNYNNYNNTNGYNYNYNNMNGYNNNVNNNYNNNNGYNNNMNSNYNNTNSYNNNTNGYNNNANNNYNNAGYNNNMNSSYNNNGVNNYNMNNNNVSGYNNNNGNMPNNNPMPPNPNFPQKPPEEGIDKF